MSGHSKWSTIKRKKAVVDAKRGRIFTKIARELQIAAREGGADPESNIRLRLTLDKARAANMPKEGVERAIARGAGSEKGDEIEETMYEGYGPGGIALLVEVLTDNRNRTVAEVRHAFSKAGGNLAAAGAVAWQFDRKGQIIARSDGMSNDDMFLNAVEAGAEDVEFNEDGTAEISTGATELALVRDALIAASIEVESAELTMQPQNEIEVSVAEALKVMNLIEHLEELDDVQKVHSNLLFSDELLAALEAE